MLNIFLKHIQLKTQGAFPHISHLISPIQQGIIRALGSFFTITICNLFPSSSTAMGSLYAMVIQRKRNAILLFPPLHDLHYVYFFKKKNVKLKKK
jgi:hypothetical protein